MAGISYKDGANWRTPYAIHYKDGATWRELSEVHYKDGGTWRQVYASGGGGSVNLTNHSLVGGGDSGLGVIGLATFSLKSDGTAEGTETDGAGGTNTLPYSGEWLVSGAAGDFESRMTTLSGSLTSGTTGTWQALSTTRTWTRNRVAAGSSSYSGTLEIRRASDGVVLETATIDLSANA